LTSSRQENPPNLIRRETRDLWLTGASHLCCLILSLGSGSQSVLTLNMLFLLTLWHILIAALCGVVNQRQQQIMEFQNAQIEV